MMDLMIALSPETLAHERGFDTPSAHAGVLIESDMLTDDNEQVVDEAAIADRLRQTLEDVKAGMM
jgi:hypothetical protein